MKLDQRGKVIFVAYSNENQNEHGLERDVDPINDSNDTGMNGMITINEDRQALKRMKNGKAVGYDGIPSEILSSEQCVLFLFKLFQTCFEMGSFHLSGVKVL